MTSRAETLPFLTAFGQRADTVERERRPHVPGPVDAAVLRALIRLRPAWWRLRPADWREAHGTIRRSKRLRGLDDAALAGLARDQAPLLLRDGYRGRPMILLAAAVREMTRRRIGFAQHPVQMAGGLALLRGRLVEMATGEGKTLTTLLPAIAAALTGVPVHVVTVNDYLVERDADTLRPVIEAFGLVVATVTEETDIAARPALYLADVVFASGKTVAFDYLRDRAAEDAPRHALAALAARSLSGHWRDGRRAMSRGLGFAIVDEVDSILIDEAQTPLILTRERPGEHADTAAFLALAGTLHEGADYELDRAKRRIRLLPPSDPPLEALDLVSGDLRPQRARRERLVQALSALLLYHRDEHYIVAPDKEGTPAVQIVDEFTGRVMPDRKWQSGLHQAIEVKEGVEPSALRETFAEITYQTFFSRYLWFGGMTGTAQEVARELRFSFGRRLFCLPTHRRLRRRHLGTRAYGSSAARWRAVARDAARMVGRGRPVMVGTRSVAASEAAAEALRGAGVSPVVLNARQNEDEARIVAGAGRAGQVTVVTNMAGRGTDIPVPPQVERKGGLHVILTEFHGSARIDRQLYGRTGRQGQRGTTRAIVSLEDALFADHAAPALWLVRRVTWRRAGRVPGLFAGILRRLAQAGAEARARRRRRQTVEKARKLLRSLAFQADRI